MRWLVTLRRVRWSWALAGAVCLVIGFATFTSAATQSCLDGEQCWPTFQDRLGQGLIAIATIAAVGWCAWRALRHDPGLAGDPDDGVDGDADTGTDGHATDGPGPTIND